MENISNELRKKVGKLDKKLEDKLLEDELNGNTPQQPQFIGTGIPGKVSKGTAWGEKYENVNDGEFGRQLAREQIQQTKLLTTKSEVLRARLEYEQQKEMENKSNTY